MPAAFIDGQESSLVYVWIGSSYQLKQNLSGDGSQIWYSYRNVNGVTIYHQENGETGVNIFFKNFLTRKPIYGSWLIVQ